MAGEFRRDEAGASARGGEERQIFWVIEKREIPSGRAIQRPHVPDRKTEIRAICRLDVSGLGDSPQGKGAGALEETWMFHQILTGSRRDMGHDAKP